MIENKSRDDRTRNWNILVYPESAPEDWRDIIDKTHCEWVESPLHDKDLDEKGEIKKAHYHVTWLAPSKKSYEQVQELTDSINAPRPEKCGSVKGSIRYMAHLDHPDKHQYESNDIVCHGGADLSALCAPTASERLQIQLDILDYIDECDIMEFADIVVYARASGKKEWSDVLLNRSTMSIDRYLSSRRHKAQGREDFETAVKKEADWREKCKEWQKQEKQEN
jgi:hypothetical protein